MIFKKIRPLIFSPLVLIIGEQEINNVDVNDPEIDIYNYYEVIGIRAWAFIEDEGAVVISLKPAIADYYTEAKTTQIRGSYESGFTCKK